MRCWSSARSRSAILKKYSRWRRSERMTWAAHFARTNGPLATAHSTGAGGASLILRVRTQHPQHRVDQHRRHTHGDRHFPPDVHELIVAIPGKRAAEPDHQVHD